MPKKYEVNSNLKSLLNEGKTSTFSLTNLFDSNNFKNEDDHEAYCENELNDEQHELEHELEHEDTKVRFNDSRKRKRSTNEESDEEMDESENFDTFHQNTQEQPFYGSFFFSENDERFERFKFFDESRNEKHHQEWDKKRQQLIQALSKRRKLMKKKESNKDQFINRKSAWKQGNNKKAKFSGNKQSQPSSSSK